MAIENEIGVNVAKFTGDDDSTKDTAFTLKRVPQLRHKVGIIALYPALTTASGFRLLVAFLHRHLCPAHQLAIFLAPLPPCMSPKVAGVPIHPRR